MAQPTWLETQRVMRALVPASRTTGISTVSTCRLCVGLMLMV